MRGSLHVAGNRHWAASGEVLYIPLGSRCRPVMRVAAALVLLWLCAWAASRAFTQPPGIRLNSFFALRSSFCECPCERVSC